MHKTVAPFAFTFLLSLGAFAQPVSAPKPVAPVAPVGVAPAKPVAAPTPTPNAVSAEAKASRAGVVTVEQGGRPVALGMVLNGDGRVLTAASRITPGQLFVRFADGSTQAARLAHTDSKFDLALLVPQTAKWQSGIKAERGPSTGKHLIAFTLGANRVLTPSSISIAGTTQTRGTLSLQLSSPPKPTELGGPLVNEQGEAIGLVVSGCSTPVNTCSEPAIGLPVSAIRQFLAARPPESGFALPRLGIVGVPVDTGVVRGLRVAEVEAQSPAAPLKLKLDGTEAERDILVAVGGAPVPTNDAFKLVLSRHAPGDRVDLLLFGKDGYRTVTTRLAPPATPKLGLAPTPLTGKPAVVPKPAAPPTAAKP